MTDRDPDTGQFTPTMPNGFMPSTASDYVPYDDGVIDEPDALSLDEARDAIMSWDDEDLARNQNIDGGEPIKFDDLDPRVTFTPEQAEKILSDTEAARAADEDQKAADKFRDEIDKLREENQPVEAKDPADPTKALEEPAVKAAIEKATSDAQQTKTEAETARTAYAQALNAAQAIARSALVDIYPQLGSLPLEQWEGALAAEANANPQKFQSAMGVLSRGAQIEAAQQQHWQQQEAQRQAAMQEYARAESAKFEESIKDTPKSERAEIESAIVGAIGKAGGDIQQFANLMRSSEFASATVQKMLWDYGRLLVGETRRASTPAPRPTRQVPTVMRPGSPSNMSSSDRSLLAADRYLDQTGSEEAGWAYLQAKMKARG